MRKLSFLLFLLVGIYSVPGFAGISLSTMLVNFAPGQPPRQDITVRNNDAKTAYVEVKTYLVKDAGEAGERKVTIRNPREMGLLVTPKKIVIPGHQWRRVRLVLTRPPGKMDRVYRLSVNPVLGKLVAEHGAQKKHAAVKIVLGYGVLVTVRPKKMRPQVTIKRVGENLLVSNRGNTNVILLRGKVCPSNKRSKEKCRQLEDRRLYAGNTWTVKAAPGSRIDFQQRIIGQSSNLHAKG